MTLSEFFNAHPRCALGFSGGTDSAFLLYEGLRLGAEIAPYFVKTAFQPEFELEDARRLCAELGVELRLIEADILALPEVSSNPKERCYYCKRHIFTLLRREAAREGISAVIDGTNASDKADDRPGMRAISELGVLSPLRLCGITKPELRRLSRERGLFTHDKPSYACLATRVPTGTEISPETLRRVERGEARLRSLGFSDLRLRIVNSGAKLELPEAQLIEAVQRRAEILKALGEDFESVALELRGR